MAFQRFKRPQSLIGIGSTLGGLGYFLTEVFTGGIPLIWPFSTGIWISLGLIAIGILFIIWGLTKTSHNGEKGSSALSDSDKEYMSRINRELQNISKYYEHLSESINIKKISTVKIKKVDKMVNAYLGLKTVAFSKPPKLAEIFKGLCFLYYDLFKMLYLLIKAKFNSSYLIRIFLDLGSIPDDAGIGLSSYDKRSKQLNNNLLGIVGERIALSETITMILRCKDACYAMNNIYLWLLMYPKAHKKGRLDFKKVIKTLYKSREKMMAYAFADVNKAVIKEFLGD